MNKRKCNAFGARISNVFYILRYEVFIDGRVTKVLMGPAMLRKQTSKDDGIWAYEINGGEIEIHDSEILAEVLLKREVTMDEYLRGEVR